MSRRSVSPQRQRRSSRALSESRSRAYSPRGDPQWIHYRPSKQQIEKTLRLPIDGAITQRRIEKQLPRLSPSIREKILKYKSPKEGRGSGQRGWTAVRPYRKAEKRSLPSECFMIPEARKFPICAYDTKALSPEGLNAAYIRANQWHYDELADAVDVIRKAIAHRQRPTETPRKSPIMMKRRQSPQYGARIR